MIRENLLKAKHDEISTCLTSRKRKLRELYSISFATVNIAAGDQSNHFDEGLASFLNANNLQQGRKFDASSLQFGHGRTTREDSRDQSAQAGPHLFRPDLRDIDANPQSLASSATRGNVDKNRSSSTHGIASKAAPDLSQRPTTSTSLLSHKAPLATAPTIYTASSTKVQDELSSSDQVTQPNKSGYHRSDTTHKENVSPTSTSNTRASPEGRGDGLVQASASIDDDSCRSQEAATLLSTSIKVVSQQTATNLGESYPTPAVTEAPVTPESTVPPKATEPLLPTTSQDGNKVHTPQDTLLGAEARPPYLYHAGPSTPEEQLRREEAQSLSAFSPQTEPASALHPTPQVTVSSGSGNDDPVITSSLNNEASKRPAAVDDSESPHTHISGQRTPGMLREVSRDLTLSQRPPIHIDTTVASQGPKDPSTQAPDRAVQPKENSSAVNGLSRAAATPHPSSPTRMTTRVSSGALRQKSVSEILGETPRPSPHSLEKSPADTPSVESPGFRLRQSDLRERERERSKLSTVVFAKQPQKAPDRGTNTYGQDFARKDDEQRDYLLSLFHYQASQSQSTSNISTLLGSSHKTLTTANHFTDLHEKQMYRITRRIYDMQNTHHWPLRQVQRSAEPVRPATYWDALMGHIKWLRTDFREERKWKLTLAKNLADWCAEWVASPSERRPLLQVKTTKRPTSLRRRASVQGSEKRASMSRSNDDGSIPERTPDLMPSREDDSSDFVEDDSPALDITRTGAPAAIFSLAPEDVVFALNKSPVADRMLSELCLYQPWIDPEVSEPGVSHRTFDTEWNTPLLPVSKYAAGKLQFVNDKLPHKRGRYDYESENESGNSQPAVGNLQPDQSNVALFDPENKHIRDRIHAGHSFRPPSEYPMPSQGFFEARNSSQWTIGEDDELKRLVREYAYNWSLISSCLASSSLFSSGPERRTPWECFERWVALEGLPTDMAKTHYFRLYHARLDAAQRTINVANQALQQQHANNPQIPIRRRTSQPVRVERRRNAKHMVMVQAMAKLAKRRETAAQKQQHVASLAAMRKANETVQPRQRIQTPQEWSRFKYERDCKRLEQQRLHMEQNKAANAQKAQQMVQQQAGPSVSHSGRNSVAVAAAANSSPHLGTAIANGPVPPGSQGQIASLQGAQSLANGVANSSQIPNGIGPARGGHAPQAQMSFMQNQAQRVYAEAGRVQQEQQRYLHQQRLQNQAPLNGQNGGQSPVASSNSSAHQNNAAMMASMQASNGVPSPSPSAAQPAVRTMASPRPSSSVPVQQPLSSGMVPMVSTVLTHFKTTRPDLSPEQQKQMANEYLESYRRRQNAMQAAAGHGSANPNPSYPYPNGQRPQTNGVNPMANPQIMYAQMLRSQQESQRHRNGVNGNLRPPSRDSQQPPAQQRASVGSNGLGQSP